MSQQYPNDQFEGLMRYCARIADSEEVVPAQKAGQPIPENTMFMYVPRIRCLDCPGKLYTPGPDVTLDNFEIHLRNSHHRDNVNQRVGLSAAAPPPDRPAA